MKKIIVIGAGTMGNGIAHTFAQNDFNVTLIDISKKNLDKAILTIGNNLDRMVKKEIISNEKNFIHYQILRHLTKLTKVFKMLIL